MADELYDSDVLLWGGQQANLLRRLAEAQAHFTPSMRHEIDLEKLFRQAG